MMESLGEDRNQKPWPGPSAIVTSCEGWRESHNFPATWFPSYRTERGLLLLPAFLFTVFIHPPSLGKGAESIPGSLFVFLRTVGCAEVGLPFTPKRTEERHRQVRLNVENITLERQLQARVVLAAHS